MSPWALNRLVNAIARGAVFGYPTDTLWGFGCHPLLAASVARILQIKKRTPDKGLILLASSIEFCSAYLEATPSDLEPVLVSRTNPTTWLVSASEYCPAWIRGRHPTVAIRVTDHPLLQQICERLQAPIVSTSANRSGCSTARNVWQMHKQFSTQLDYIVTGYETGSDRPSTIKSLSSGIILRGN